MREFNVVDLLFFGGQRKVGKRKAALPDKPDKCLNAITLKVISKLLNFGPAGCGTSLVYAVVCGENKNSLRSDSLFSFSTNAYNTRLH